MTDADDLDSFIRQQKQKIAKERQNIGKREDLNGLNNARNGGGPPIQPETILSDRSTDDKRRKWDLDKRKEYTEQILEEENFDRTPPTANDFKENLPPKPETPEVALVTKLGGYEDKKKRLQEERKREYNMLLAQKEFRRTGGSTPKPESSPTTIPPPPDNDRSSAKERKRKEMEAYKEYLRSQRAQQTQTRKTGPVKPYSKHDGGYNEEPRRLPASDSEEAYLASLPGLKDRSSAEAQKMMERNREYNELLQSKKPQARAIPPRPRYPDSDGEEYSGRPAPRKGWATPTYDEILEKKRKEEQKYRRYNDPGYEGLRSSRSDTNLNRPSYDLDERGFRDLDREYERKKVRFRDPSVYQDPSLEFSEWLTRLKLKYDSEPVDSVTDNIYGRPPRSRSQGGRDRSPARYDDRRRDHSPHYDDPYDSAPRRHDNAPRRYDDKPYSNQSSRVPLEGTGATLLIGSEKRPSADQRGKEQYRQELESQMRERRQTRDKERLEDMRVNATGAYDVGRRPDRQQLPERRPPDKRPPELYRTLSQPAISYRSALEDPYSYYADRNPLETQLGLAGIGVDPGPPSNRPKVTFDSNPPIKRDQAPATTPFPVENDNQSQRAQHKQYQEDLKRQMKEQEEKKRKQREEQERFDKKMDEEISKYDPFGRGGGGAPMKDAYGNVIANWKQAKVEAERSNPSNQRADLREMHMDNKDPNKKLTPRGPPPPSSTTFDTSKTSEKDTFERGGHGIFGQPMTDVEKLKRNQYQDFLRQQMEDKKRQQEEEKEKQRLEDEKLLRKIEEDQQKIQKELEDEKRKEREKLEKAQQQQEELRRQQEEKRKEEERKRQEADDKRQQELRRQEDERRQQRQREEDNRRRAAEAKSQYAARSSSPPIPTHKPKNTKQDSRGNSPPVPTLRSNTDPPASPPVPARRTQSRQSRAASADVLNQLARMRQQLHSERKRVESDLQKEKDEPEVYDARLHKPQAKPNVDVFEIARKREPVAVHRQPAEVNPKNLQDFKNHRNKEDLSKMNPKDLGLLRDGSTLSAQLLESDSAFIDVPNGSRAPSGYKGRNTSARNRHRQRSANTDRVGSVTSLDPDKITEKNDERLRRLKSLADDDVSLNSADPDDILDRFMAKQQHTRPPSGQTLVDDSWIRPGTHIV